MFARVIAKRTFGRSLSTVNHRATIAQNYLVLQQLQAATDDASLAAASKFNGTVDLANLPAGLAPLKEFLATPAATGAKGFQPDAKGWQYLGAAEYVSEESTRNDHYPFMLSAVAAYLLLGVLVPTLIGKEEEKNSKYISRIEGRFGKLEHGAHH